MSNFNAKDHVGQSIALQGLGLKDAIPTVHGPKPAMSANFVNLVTGESLEDILVFNKVLIKQMQEADNSTVIGTLKSVAIKDSNGASYYMVDAPSTKELLAAARAGI